MHLQILLVGTLLACVCSRYVPPIQSQQLASSMRPRRNTISSITSLPVHKEQKAPNETKVIARRYAQPIIKEVEQEEHHAPVSYEYKYTVHDIEHHDIKHHEEKREGDHTVGQYSVLQPDGTYLTVKYTVHGDEGYNAIVTKSEFPAELLHP